jgi:hypothetical protein
MRTLATVRPIGLADWADWAERGGLDSGESALDIADPRFILDDVMRGRVNRERKG